MVCPGPQYQFLRQSCCLGPHDASCHVSLLKSLYLKGIYLAPLPPRCLPAACSPGVHRLLSFQQVCAITCPSTVQVGKSGV